MLKGKRKMKIIIIGANSYIARNLLFVLNDKYLHCEVKLYDRAEIHADKADNYFSVNVLDKRSVQNIDFICDIVFMFTGKTGSIDGFDDYDTFIDVNEKALLNILNEYKKQRGTAKIVFPSTRLVYKGRDGMLSENDAKEFKTIYAINKFACEQYLKQYQRVFGVKYCIFRICIPYGTLVPNASSYGTAEFMLNKAQNGNNISLYGDGSVRRTITYMGDLCTLMIEGAFSEKCENDVFNIYGEDYSLKEMAELIAEKYNVKVEFVKWPNIAEKIESGNTVFDGSKLRRILHIENRMKFSNWIEGMGVDA